MSEIFQKHVILSAMGAQSGLNRAVSVTFESDSPPSEAVLSEALDRYIRVQQLAIEANRCQCDAKDRHRKVFSTQSKELSLALRDFSLRVHPTVMHIFAQSKWDGCKRCHDRLQKEYICLQFHVGLTSVRLHNDAKGCGLAGPPLHVGA